MQSSTDIFEGIDDSVFHYILNYNNSESGESCGSATVPSSSCVDGVCQHSFTYKESACNATSIDINVTISAANILGSGPTSDPVLIQGTYVVTIF